MRLLFFFALLLSMSVARWPNQQLVAPIPTDANGYIMINASGIFSVINCLWPVPFTQEQRNPALGQVPIDK